MAETAMNATRRLVELNRNLSFDQLSPRAVEMAKLCIIDWFGVAIGGSDDPLVNILVDEANQRGAIGESTLPGRRERLNVVDAALVNGTMAHALDYDDGNASMLGHPTAPIAGALLPVAESLGASGREVIAAFAAGYDTAARTGLLAGQPHYSQGFHPTGTVGAIGAAMACSRLM